MRWREDSGDSDFDSASPITQSLFLVAARRAMEVPASPMHVASCDGGCSVSCPVIITKKRRRRRCHRRAKSGDADGPPAAPRRPVARVPAYQRLGPRPVTHAPVHQRLGSQPPRCHVPHTGTSVDADGFALVQSHHRWRRRAPPHPRRQRPVPPSLVGLCFNCLAKDHVAARCAFPPRCLLCLSMAHRARNCMHDRSRSSDELRAPTKRGPRCRVPDGNHGRPHSRPRHPRLRDSQDAGGAPESQLGPTRGLKLQHAPLSLWDRFSAQPNRGSVPLHLDHADNASR
jgi:hypothetical protein